jgi:hypothetical protein
VWLIYALGGGWGHLTRALALGRIAARDRPVRILTNSPYAGMVWPAFGRLTGGTACPTSNALDLVALDARATAEETRAAVMRQIAECRPSCMIVDTFPRGIGGELVGVLGNLRARKVLVQRDLNPRYVAAARLREFVAAHYDLVLAPDGWLVRCAGEIPDRGHVEEALRLGPNEEHSVLVSASGKAEELGWYGAVVAELLERSVTVRCIAAECPPRCPVEYWVQYWPAMDLFGCAAVVVGGAGYNTVEECLAWNVPLVTRPWPRKYDRQELRAQWASARGRVIAVQDPEEAARAAIELNRDGPSRVPEFLNGAVEAVERIGLLF